MLSLMDWRLTFLRSTRNLVNEEVHRKDMKVAKGRKDRNFWVLDEAKREVAGIEFGVHTTDLRQVSFTGWVAL